MAKCGRGGLVEGTRFGGIGQDIPGELEVLGAAGELLAAMPAAEGHVIGGNTEAFGSWPGDELEDFGDFVVFEPGKELVALLLVEGIERAGIGIGCGAHFEFFIFCVLAVLMADFCVLVLVLIPCWRRVGPCWSRVGGVTPRIEPRRNTKERKGASRTGRDTGYGELDVGCSILDFGSGMGDAAAGLSWKAAGFSPPTQIFSFHGRDRSRGGMTSTGIPPPALPKYF